MGLGKKKIIEAIRAAESNTSGEIRVHLSNRKKEESLLEAAKTQFFDLGMEKTKDRNGILLYVNTKLHRFALFGDEGIHQKVGQDFWERLSREMTTTIQTKDLTEGIVHTVHEMGQALKSYFPRASSDQNELNDDVTES